MINGEDFLIIEPEDIESARDHLDRISRVLKKMIDTGAPEVGELGDSAKAVTVDIFVLTTAARIGEEISRRQGGLTVLEEGAPQDVKNKAAAALAELQMKSGLTPAPADVDRVPY